MKVQPVIFLIVECVFCTLLNPCCCLFKRLVPSQQISKRKGQKFWKYKERWVWGTWVFTVEAVYPQVCRIWSREERDRQHGGKWDGKTDGWWRLPLQQCPQSLHERKITSHIKDTNNNLFLIITINVSGLFYLTFLCLLLSRRLRGHIDRCGCYWDWTAPWNQVQFHGLPGDVSGRHLHLFGQAQIGAETWHEVTSCNEVHTRLKSLQDKLEATANLLLRDPRHGTDFWGGGRYELNKLVYQDLLKY